jgi:hypothetical protein
MKNKHLFSALLLLFGEALIIISFMFFGSSLDTNILILDIVVSSIIYSLLFIDVLIPMLNFKEKSQKIVGSLGIRWFITTIYIILAFGAMVVFIFIKPIDINGQILIQAIIFFVLLIGLYSAATSSDKVEEIFLDESQKINRLAEIRKSIEKLQFKLFQLKNVPPEIISGIADLYEELRYISPCNNAESIELEANLLKEVKAINDSLFDVTLDSTRIMERISLCQRICHARKLIFSN